MAFREREMGQSCSSVLRPRTILRNAAGEGMSCPGKEAIRMTPEPTSDAAAHSQEIAGSRLRPPDKNIPSTPATPHSVGTLALWGLDSKHQTRECEQEAPQSQGFGSPGPATCFLWDPRRVCLPTGLRLAFYKVRSLDGPVEGPSCSQGTKGLAVESHLGKQPRRPRCGRVQG